MNDSASGPIDFSKKTSMPGIGLFDTVKNIKTKKKFISRIFYIADDSEAKDYASLLSSIYDSAGKMNIVEQDSTWTKEGLRAIFMTYSIEVRVGVDSKKDKKNE